MKRRDITKLLKYPTCIGVRPISGSVQSVRERVLKRTWRGTPQNLQLSHYAHQPLLDD